MKIVKMGLAAVLALGMSGAAMAEGMYAGVKLGIMNIDVSGTDNATNGGLLLGYEFAGDDSMRMAVEGEFSTSMSEGGITGGGKWDVQTSALYVAMRVGDEAYLKVKAGVLREDVTASGGGLTISGDDTGGSFGIGAGMRLGDGELEAEYTLVEQDIDFISIGYNIHF